MKFSKSPVIRNLGAAVVVVAMAALAGCSSQESEVSTEEIGPTTPVTVGLTYVPDIQFSPFYVAQENGYFEEEGLEVTLRHHGASEGLFTAFDAGDEDVVFAGGDEMTQALSQSTSIVNFATLYQKYPVSLITTADSGIDEPEDIKGKTIGVPGPFGETWFGLLALLQKTGLTQDDVDIQNIGFTQFAALSTDKVDAVMGYSNNDAVRFTSEGIDVKSFPVVDENAPALVGAGLGTSPEFLDENSEDLSAMIRALRRAVRDIAEDPSSAVETSISYVPGLSEPAQRQSAEQVLGATVPLYGDPAQLGRQEPEKWEAMVAFMDEQELLENPVEPTQAFDDTVVVNAEQ